MRNSALIISLLFLSFFMFQCGRSEPPDMGIDVSVDLEEVIYDNSIIDITYTWSFNAPQIEFNPNIKVFVHFWNLDKKKMVVQDDHILPIENWEINNEINYTHNLFIPHVFRNVEDILEGGERIRLNIGLYSASDPSFNYLIFSKTYSFQPYPHYYPRVFYHYGWFNEETIGTSIHESWRWTNEKAVLIVDNIGQDMELHFIGSVVKEVLPEQAVSIYAEEHLLEEFIPDEDDFYKIILIPNELIRDKISFKIQIVTDQTFISSEQGICPDDHRQLGVKVYFLYFRALPNQ